MEFSSTLNLDKRKKADLLVIPFWKEQNSVKWAIDPPAKLKSDLADILKMGDFKAKEGELLSFYDHKAPEKRIMLLGLGPKNKISTEILRRAYGNVTRSCVSKKLLDLNVVMPHVNSMASSEVMTGVVEGLLLPNYIFDRLKVQSPEDGDKLKPLHKIHLIGISEKEVHLANKLLTICECVYYARDLVNGNADDITPQYLAKCAQKIAKDHPKVKATIFNKARIEKEHLDLLLAVNRGSALDPAFIILEYKGDPKSKENVVLVGKGVTYDTGGLNIKATGGMETMKCDMAGGAACLGAMLAVARLHLKVNFSIVVPTTENGVDAKSFKPGDVYKSYAGKTVEMTNSDAEGRLILADALAYAVRNLKPTCLIDIATLTGAIEIALGSDASGLMSTDDKLAGALIRAGEQTFERLWRMPLYEEYKEKLKSDFADLKSWNGRSASSNVAATFLRQFVDEKIPWAHIDIAGTGFLSEAKKYQPKYGTGVGIRLILQFLENQK